MKHPEDKVHDLKVYRQRKKGTPKKSGEDNWRSTYTRK